MKRFFLCLALVFLILISGCIGDSDTETHKAQGEGRTKGIEIIEFSAPAKVESGETVEINLYLQNLGASEGSIYDPDGITGTAISIYQSSGFSGNKEFQGTGSMILNPPEKEYNIAGDVFSGYWTLTAPEVVKDQTRSLFCKVHYSYESKASTNIELVSKAMWDSKGGASSFKTYSTKTEGPVTLEIIPVPAIKISDPNIMKKEDIPIDIILKNTGSGVISDDYVYHFELSIKGEHNDYFNKEDQESADITCDSVEGNTNRVRIFGVEQERSFRCYLDLDFDQAKGSVGYIIEAGITYNYAVDSDPLNILIEAK